MGLIRACKGRMTVGNLSCSAYQTVATLYIVGHKQVRAYVLGLALVVNGLTVLGPALMVNGLTL